LEASDDRDYVDICQDKYKFTLLPDEVLAFARESIELIKNHPPNDYTVATDE
jgi:hypothetical protein